MTAQEQGIAYLRQLLELLEDPKTEDFYCGITDRESLAKCVDLAIRCGMAQLFRIEAPYAAAA